MYLRTRRALAAGLVAGLAVPLALAAGCSDDASGAATSGTVKIGFVASLSGIYQTVGEDMRDGFELYVELNDGQLGGRDVELVWADEGDGPETSLPAAEQLIRQEQVDVLAGIVGGGSYAAVAPLASENEIPLVGANGRPTLEADQVEWLWHTSFISDEPGKAIAPYLYENVDGPVYAIGPDYQGGHDELRGFVDAFTALGGELANPDGETRWTPFPDTADFIPYFSEIAQTDAEAVYTFYAGKAAIDFVTQYAQSEISDLPLYGAFLTEGAILDAQGEAAEGIWNVLNYSPDLDNAANRAFVAEWSTQHGDRTPTTFAMASWDAALVLDQAIGAIEGEVGPAAINEAIAGLGEIDSPRGKWQFSEQTHAPIQPWYLRVVAPDGGRLSNVLVSDLATVGE
jgi:branched-chain amino acid transport system substrate-binding protein